MNTVFQRCVNYALKKVCFHNTPWCVNLHTPKTHLIMCYFKDKRCVWRTHHGVFWEHTCFYSVLEHANVALVCISSSVSICVGYTRFNILKMT